MNRVRWVLNQKKCTSLVSLVNEFNPGEIAKARDFHQTFDGYYPTPLQKLNGLTKSLGLAGLYVKDESCRFGLNAFKVLGGSYAIGWYLAKLLGIDMSDLSFEKLNSSDMKNKLGEITFVTATDGNHGRGVAWAAARLGQKSIVYMPKGSAEERSKNIQREGAKVIITDLNYDDTVRLAAANAKKYGWVVVQDTAWEGYNDVPLWIMQGYSTIVMEILEQFAGNFQVERPTHVFLQAGVGSFAAAVQAAMINLWPNTSPKFIIVEPNAADCIYKSFSANDGKPRFVNGEMNTIMAGLACGEPNKIAWEIMCNYSEMSISCPDWVAARGMRILGNPLHEDARVISGESGAVTTGIVCLLMTEPSLKEARLKLGLDKYSHVLVFNTEGDTNPQKYRSIVWDGEYPSYVKM